jgi:methionyl-tRNA formyltransferase
MNFAITASDRYLGVFDAFVCAGWKPLKLFTLPMKDILANQHAVISYAQQYDAAIQLSRMTSHDLAELNERGCDVLIVAGYDWKICDWRPFLKYGVNFHPSPLPEGRGPYPIVRAIKEKKDSWAVTCHRLTQEIDKGDILASDKFSLQSDECHESLNLKIQMSAKRLATRVACEFTELWEQAQPQEAGSYWKRYELNEIIIDFQKPVESIMRHIRSFGVTGSFANLSYSLLIVKRAVGWTEPHGHVPGHVVHLFNNSIIVAAADGYIGILESEFAPPNLVAQMQASLIKETKGNQQSLQNPN